MLWPGLWTISRERRSSKTFNKLTWWWLKPSETHNLHLREMSGKSTSSNTRSLRISLTREGTPIPSLTLSMGRVCCHLCNPSLLAWPAVEEYLLSLNNYRQELLEGRSLTWWINKMLHGKIYNWLRTSRTWPLMSSCKTIKLNTWALLMSNQRSTGQPKS